MSPCNFDLSKKTSIAVDIMSGDAPIESRMHAIKQALQDFSFLQFVIVGDRKLLESYQNKIFLSFKERLTYIFSDSVVEMHDKPSFLLRSSKKSSMKLALNSVLDRQADGCVTSGNTGALVALSTMLLKTFNDIKRPAIAATVPGKKGSTLWLDVGGNVDCSSELLFQFACMGDCYVKETYGIKSPTIGLLNIGMEENKGSKNIREVHKLLSNCPDINYVGYIEASDAFSNLVDVIVSDGVNGNIALKTAEGVTNFIVHKFKFLKNKNIFSSVFFNILSYFFKTFINEMNPQNYNGASLLGVNGVVVKSHGNADQYGFYSAIIRTIKEIHASVPERLSKKLRCLS